MKEFTLITHHVLYEGLDYWPSQCSVEVPADKQLSNKQKKNLKVFIDADGKSKFNMPVEGIMLQGNIEEILIKIIKHAAFSLAYTEHPQNFEEEARKLIKKFIK